ncbi:MAG: hypothetical protein C4558_05980 [Dehalococcoidia bacterium]|nr:MAG: hypothetical protein C4558_05980 [Dehalococcoidia bacterium]
MPLTLTDLIENRTLSPEMAATLAAAAEERRSLLFVAIPRWAGKSTIMQAVLRYAPSGAPFHELSAARPDLGIPASGDGGYLIAGEISPAGFVDYFWGADVRQVFAALERGFALATALHAGSVDEAFEVLTRENGVPANQAARIDMVVYIRSIGDDWSHPERRTVAAIAETDGIHARQARLLHHWSEPKDRFEAVEQSQRIDAITIERYRREFGAG